MTWADWAGFVLALAGVLSYIRTWRNERIRLSCLNAVGHQWAKVTVPMKAEDIVKSADTLERYVRKGKPKTAAPRKVP